MKDSKPVLSIEPEQAMQQILQAERDAESAILNCENEAQQTIHAAQKSAQRIHARANQRITNMEMRHAHNLERLVKAIEKEGIVEIRHDASHPYDKERLKSVVEKLAIELCQGDSTVDGDLDSGA